MLGGKTAQRHSLRLLGKEAGILGMKVVADEEGSPVLEAGCGEAEEQQEGRAGTARGAELLTGHIQQLFVGVVVCDTTDV